jgi:hypothetical protein
MFIFKKHLSRRTFLRGSGAIVALPFLEAMAPAQTPIRQTAAAKTRLACFYVPHGATMDKWTPATTGTGFEFTEILKPLESFRDHVNIVSGLGASLRRRCRAERTCRRARIIRARPRSF